MAAANQNNARGASRRHFDRNDRAAKRMYEFNSDRALSRPGTGWAEQSDVEDRYEAMRLERPGRPDAQSKPSSEPRESGRGRGRSAKKAERVQKWKSIQKDGKKGESSIPIERNTQAKAEDSFSIEMSGTRPVARLYSINYDFGSYPLLLGAVYQEMRGFNPRITRELPFSAFVHAHTSLLNAWTLDTVKKVNGEDRLPGEAEPLTLIPPSFTTHQAIADYLSHVNTVLTPSGDTVRFNLPEVAIPHLSVIDPDNGQVLATPGSFGPLTGAQHNKYECYVSPLVTANTIREDRRAAAAQVVPPLPDGLGIPVGAVPNANLLGYYARTEMHVEARNLLQRYNFPQTEDMAGRLQIVPECFLDVSDTMSRLDRNFKLATLESMVRKPVLAPLAFYQVNQYAAGIQMNTGDLKNAPGMIYSPYALPAGTAGAAALFSLRRNRTNACRGFCYTLANGAALGGWQAGLNSNFTMIDDFAPEIGVDGPQFRAPSHEGYPPAGVRLQVMTDWIHRYRTNN